ncbi:MAG: PAS domain S-box protein [Terracidiphilus sp.]|jgi:PAS domain S-box-containing protein
MRSGSIIYGYYDYRLIALSVCISILAAYAALDLGERVKAGRGWTQVIWLYGGAMAMGIGIWATHCVGMSAFELPVPVRYDWPSTVLSLVTAVGASGVALYIVSRPAMGMASTFAGSLIMGSGIAAMHYIGMEAMRLQATRIYSPGGVALSVALAIAVSFLVLQWAFARREDLHSWSWRKFLSSFILGLSIPVTYAVGMAAVRFTPGQSISVSLANSVSVNPFSMAVISIATIVILGHVLMISTISRRMALSAQHRTESEIQLKTIFDSLTEGIVVIDKDYNPVQMNPAAARVLGLPGQTLSTETVKGMVEEYTLDGELIPGEQWPGARALRGDYVQNLEIRLYSSYAGTSTIAEVSTAPILNAAGETLQIVITYRDVTERKRIDEARSRLAAIAESSEDAIIGKDLQGIVTSWNKGAEKIFGYTTEEMIGQSIMRLHPPGHEHEEEEILASVRKGQTVKHSESVRLRKNGQTIYVSLTISPILDARNKVVGVSKIASDITAKKMLERQLRQSQKMEAIGQLTGGIAHDFNNLLGVIVGNLDLLERQVPENQAALKRVQTAQKAATRGTDLTRRMLALASKEDLNPVNLQLEDAIQEMIELAGRALGPEIRIVSSFDKSVPAVYVDAAGLESALLNLAVNARDAMPKGGTLTINTELCNLEESFPPVQTGDIQPGMCARISVTDTGVGMSRETLDRALEPFYTTKARNKGTGLGLSMVYGFARQSGGTIRLYSEQDIGTTVSLYLPLAENAVPTKSEALPMRLPAKPGGKVLVVDDEAALLEIAQAYLTEMGYSALLAEDSARALEIVTRFEEIDLMVTDIIMPGGMNGVDLARMARQLSPKLKIIYTSGFPADALSERSGMQVDAPLLRKPYQRAEFTAMIQSAMEEAETDGNNGSAAIQEERFTDAELLHRENR